MVHQTLTLAFTTLVNVLIDVKWETWMFPENSQWEKGNGLCLV
jgi:hypothetical protein